MYAKWMYIALTLFRKGGQKGAAHTSFPPLTSTNVEISLQNFLIISSNTFATLV